MKTIASWDHLRPFGINALTGEACSVMYRLLCDITEDGKRVIEKCLSCELRPPENWNSGAVGSIMLTPGRYPVSWTHFRPVPPPRSWANLTASLPT